MMEMMERLAGMAKYEALEAAVDNAPTVDAELVIRCKNCTWRQNGGMCPKVGHPVSDDFYCAHGTTQEIRRYRRKKG